MQVYEITVGVIIGTWLTILFALLRQFSNNNYEIDAIWTFNKIDR